jgi:hypothetical protein
VEGLEGNPDEQEGFVNGRCFNAFDMVLRDMLLEEGTVNTRETEQLKRLRSRKFAKRTTWLECMIIEPSCSKCSVIATVVLVVFGDLANKSAAKLMETLMNDIWD